MAASAKQKKWSKDYYSKVKDSSKFKTKKKARNKQTNAVRDGRATMPSKAAKCPNCGKTGYQKELHHTDYGKATGKIACSACNPRPGNKKK